MKKIMKVVMLGFVIADLGMAQGIYKRAGLDRYPIEDVESYINQRNEEIWEASKAFTKLGRAGEALPEGIEYDGRSVFIQGRYQPTLIPVFRILGLFFGELHFKEFTPHIHKKLINRGFPPGEIETLMAISYVGEITDGSFFNQTHKQIHDRYAPQEKNIQTKEQGRALLISKEKAQAFMGSSWAKNILSQLSPAARRVLLQFAFANICDGITVGYSAMPPSKDYVEGYLKSIKAEVEK